MEGKDYALEEGNVRYSAGGAVLVEIFQRDNDETWFYSE
jgi:hypothetical protein